MLISYGSDLYMHMRFFSILLYPHNGYGGKVFDTFSFVTRPTRRHVCSVGTALYGHHGTEMGSNANAFAFKCILNTFEKYLHLHLKNFSNTFEKILKF